MPCRAASRATTNRPIRRDTATSTTGGLSSRQFAWAISSAPMPTPWSVMSSSTPPLFSRCPDTVTGVSAEENEVAFSTSSATRCTTSLTAWPRDRDARLDVHRDALVLLDLGHRRAEHVDQGDRLVPPAGKLVPRQDQQVFRVAPHPGGEVVHLEQVGQPLRVLLALLQVVDQPDLPFHQRLAAPGQVHEHRVDVAAQRGLVGRQPERFPVDLVEGPRDFTDLVGGVHVDGRDVEARRLPRPTRSSGGPCRAAARRPFPARPRAAAAAAGPSTGRRQR